MKIIHKFISAVTWKYCVSVVEPNILLHSDQLIDALTVAGINGILPCLRFLLTNLCYTFRNYEWSRWLTTRIRSSLLQSARPQYFARIYCRGPTETTCTTVCCLQHSVWNTYDVYSRYDVLIIRESNVYIAAYRILREIELRKEKHVQKQQKPFLS